MAPTDLVQEGLCKLCLLPPLRFIPNNDLLCAAAIGVWPVWKGRRDGGATEGRRLRALICCMMGQD
jgi:hypothetical protein